ncbi:hypothetical protein E3N88_04006 [Mikania micrantha]|uniref:Reverse transcriptase Ty1/copia-type domain-containing protein n=1 Tax=Mikania micrantha TaxID=192012 RepID=A0A5N6PVC7_9ASTR|nr:hypothetical protein E3N88_04006 [Mikania micrantha]
MSDTVGFVLEAVTTDGAFGHLLGFQVTLDKHLSSGEPVLKTQTSPNQSEGNHDESDSSFFDNSENNNSSLDNLNDSNQSVLDPDSSISPVDYEQSSSSVESHVSSSHYDDTPPKGFRHMNDVHSRTQVLQQIPFNRPHFDDSDFLLLNEEPATFSEANDSKEGNLAMQEELKCIEKNNTWRLVQQPNGVNPIGLKWVHHLDVKTAFLNGDLQEDAYVTQLERFEKPGKEHLVYKLVKALYGLKQAPKAWNSKLDATLKQIGFDRCPREHVVYKRAVNTRPLIVGIYVDDLIITGPCKDEIKWFITQMKDCFGMSDLGLLSYNLGIEVNQSEAGITLQQSGYATKILKDANLLECNPTKFPMDPGIKLDKDEEQEDVDATMYRRLIGCLRYLTHTPQTLIMQLVLLADSWKLQRMIFTMGGGPVAWCSQKQQTVALSSCEAEFMAAAATTCQGVWMKAVISTSITQEARAVLGRYEYQTGNIEAALRVFEGINISAVTPKIKISLNATGKPPNSSNNYVAPPFSIYTVGLLLEAAYLK